jgi:hypothetical protein
MLQLVTLSSIIKSAGILPHEVGRSVALGTDTNNIADPNGHIWKYAFGVDRIIRRRHPIPYSNLIRSILDNLENELDKEPTDLRYAHLRKPSRMVFVETLLTEQGIRDFAELELGPAPLEVQLKQLIIGYGYTWMFAVHVALIFFSSFEKAIHAVDCAPRTDIKIMRRPWDNWYKKDKWRFGFPLPCEYDFAPLSKYAFGSIF